MENFERARLDAYFAKIAAQFPVATRPAAFLVTHLLPERPSFVRAAAQLTALKAVLPKPKQVDALTRERCSTWVGPSWPPKHMFESGQVWPHCDLFAYVRAGAKLGRN